MSSYQIIELNKKLEQKKKKKYDLIERFNKAYEESESKIAAEKRAKEIEENRVMLLKQILKETSPSWKKYLLQSDKELLGIEE
jgi:hypothetical protein